MMNTAALCPCQTSGRRRTADVLQHLVLLAVLTLVSSSVRSAPAAQPAWQRELDAIRLTEATAALLADQKPAEAAETNRRLDDLFRQMSAKYPDQAAVRKAAGDHFRRTGDEAAAVSEWQAAQSLDPADAETASALGGGWLREGRTGEARAQFQRAVDARPGVAVYHFDLANVLFLFRHDLVGSPAIPDEPTAFREALLHFRRASELAPENIEYARAYAETFYGVPAPDWTEAYAAWEHVRTLTADDPDFAVGHLARISLRLGKPEQAEAYLDSIRSPDFAPMKATLHRQAEQMKLKAPAGPPP